MPQDYARSGKQNASRRPAAAPARAAPAPGGRPLLPFVAGLAAGVLLSALVWLGGWLPDRTEHAPNAEAGAGAVPPPGIRFEFPDMLRDAQVLVPYVEEYLQPEATPDADIEYLLQAGAFRAAADADRRRAQILLLDLKARTLKVTRQGESWHRVLVGPFASRAKVRDAQLKLLEDDIDSIVLKTTREGETP